MQVAVPKIGKWSTAQLSDPPHACPAHHPYLFHLLSYPYPDDGLYTCQLSWVLCLNLLGDRFVVFPLLFTSSIRALFSSLPTVFTTTQTNQCTTFSEPFASVLVLYATGGYPHIQLIKSLLTQLLHTCYFKFYSHMYHGSIHQHLSIVNPSSGPDPMDFDSCKPPC